jgi:hypothetical protein
VDGIDLPRIGTRGSRHTLLMEGDADEGAARVRDRLAGQGPRR